MCIPYLCSVLDSLEISQFAQIGASLVIRLEHRPEEHENNIYIYIYVYKDCIASNMPSKFVYAGKIL